MSARAQPATLYRLALGLLTLLTVLPWVGWGCLAGSEAQNDNAFSLEAVIDDIIADIQRSRDCGDTTTPLLTAEQLEAALLEDYDQLTEFASFESFAAEQAQVFADRADRQCGVTDGDNATANENSAADNTNDNTTANTNDNA